jgi:protein SCO1/2
VAVFFGATSFGCAHHHSTTGLILKVDQPARVTISHDAFPGYMDAMVMPFDVRGDARREKLVAGDRVKFRLAVKGGRSWVDKVEVISAVPVDAGLQQTPAVPVLVPVGAPIPDFELLDQANRRVALSSLKGKVVAVTFIYTRCPLPDFCPLMDKHFATIQKTIASTPSLADVRLVTVTLDPAFDTPKILRAHATRVSADLARWTFLTGDPKVVNQFETQLGVYVEENSTGSSNIIHNLRTAVIDSQGRLVKIHTGNDWTPAELVADLEATPAPAH